MTETDARSLYGSAWIDMHGRHLTVIGGHGDAVWLYCAEDDTYETVWASRLSAVARRVARPVVKCFVEYRADGMGFGMWPTLHRCHDVDEVAPKGEAIVGAIIGYDDGTIDFVSHDSEEIDDDH